MRKIWRIIGCGTVLWFMAAGVPAWGETGSPETETGGPGEVQKDLIEKSMAPPGGGSGKGKRPDIGQAPGKNRDRLSPRERRERVRKRVEMMRMIRLTEELKLDEDTATRLFSRLRPIEKERWNLIKERQKAQRDLNQATHSGKSDPENLKSLMESIEKKEAALSRLEEKEKDAVRSLLTPQQQAEYLIFKDRFRKEMKDRIQRARKNRASQHPLRNPQGGPPSP